jgi:hypothetical protein
MYDSLIFVSLSSLLKPAAEKSFYDPFFLNCSVPGLSFNFILIHFLIVSALYVFLAGFKPISILLKSEPNQGIRLSTQNALIYCLASGILCGTAGGPFIYRFAGLLGGIAWGVIIGVSCGLLVGLSHGGYKAIQHIALRIILWKNDRIPWDYSGFLEQVVQIRILQLVGGRYRFIHGLLQTHLVQSKPE